MSMPEGKQSIKNIFIEDRYFEIPNYQRSYAWKEKQLKDFLDDFSHIENYQKYYYGTILLQQKENTDDSYEIVDGQQRLTTLIIFMNCLIERMQAVGLSEEANELSKKYIKYKNNYILRLQDQDDGFFKSYILSNNSNKIEKTPAQKNLSYAKNYFTKALENIDEQELIGYKTRIQAANCLVYSVTDRNEAAMIFETTNDRGKLLTNLEKTKSYLMYKVSTTFKNTTSLLNTIQQGFNDIYATYEDLKGKQKFNLDENSIQQYMFIAFENWKNKKINGKSIKAYQHYLDELKATINNMVVEINSSPNDTIRDEKETLLNDYIENYINKLKDSFNAIKSMYDIKYSDFYNLISLNRMASIYPLLIKAYSLDNSKDKNYFIKLCKWCEIFCFRGLTILKYLSNKYQDTIYALARDFNGNFEKIYDEIKSLIISLGDDDKFINKLQDKDFFKEYSSQDRNYFFWSYENYLRDKLGYPNLTFDDLWQTDPKKKLTIEHIVAQNDNKDKTRILKDEKYIKIGQRKFFDKEYLHSIGNLTIDPLSANASKGKKEVAEKNSKYFTAAPLMSQNELDDFLFNGKWTIESINNRKNQIIEFAKHKWCFELKNISTPTVEDDLNDDSNDIEEE